MIQVREVFQVQFGRAREAIALAQEMVAIEERHGAPPSRLLTDLTGEYYTLVVEAEYESMAAFEKVLQESMAAPEFRDWYPRFAALMKGGRREIFRLVERPAPRALPAEMAGGTVVAA